MSATHLLRLTAELGFLAAFRHERTIQHTEALALLQMRRQDGLRPLEIWLPAAMIEMIDQLKRDDLSSREAVIAAIVATTLSVRSPEPSEGQPMML